MISKENVGGFVTVCVTVTLCIVIIGMVGALLLGLFDKNLDNTKIFEAITPAFQTIIGGLIGWLSGLKVGSHMDEVADGT